MLEPLAVARNVSREFPAGKYGSRQVLRSVDCLVLAGDRIAITGPSGSGKSTLLNLLGGLDEPTLGDVSWPGLAADTPPRSGLEAKRKEIATGPNEGRASPGKRPSSRQLGFVFQSTSLLPALTALENVCLPLMLLGDIQEMEERGMEMLDAFDLGPLANKLPGELSGGQAQRVAIARALVAKPQLVLADEPTGQLDHPTAQHVLDVILDTISQTDTALVIATHDEAVAARMAQQWVLDRGQLTNNMEQEACS